MNHAAGDETIEQIVLSDLAELSTCAGRSFLGDWFSVDAGHLGLFLEATYVVQNPYRFDQGLYPADLVEGFHLLALLDHLSNPLIRLADAPMSGWNYGFDRVRFTSQVRAGDWIRLRGTVGAVDRRRDGFLVRLDCVLEVRDRDKPALVAQWQVLFVPTPTST